MDWIADPQLWLSLFTLTALEIVLGIDNVVFVSILADKLPAEQRPRARKIWLFLAPTNRILLLVGLGWLVQRLTEPLFPFPAILGITAPLGVTGTPLGVTGKDLVMLGGGLFLLYKSTHEIHEKLEGEDGAVTARLAPNFAAVMTQILIIDLVFSLDSVVTAIGMVKDGPGKVPVMVTAVIVAMVFMMVFSKQIARVIHDHPTLKMLALSFLLLVGCLLVAEGFHQVIPKGYVYFAMAFSVGVEMLNIRLRTKRATNVELHQPYR
ncbi:MAG: TerC family protein [Pedosphaera sp.]|nr:TerC family protein [Pedosphaera sp.]